jgi:DNA-binding response OmpR family regulator
MVLPSSIVIVEDEMMAQRYLKDILSNFGIEKVEAFTNATDALEWLNLAKCDMLLADINLKGSIDGIQMAKQVLEKYDIPIIFITAYSDSTTLNDALSISPFGYIVKPFSQSDIELQIRVGYQKFLQYKSQMNGSGKITTESLKIIKINDEIEFSLTNNSIYKNGNQVYLPHKQNELVAILCKNLNTIVSYDQLEYMLWQDESHANSALRTLVYSIRSILPELQIISHSKIGYSIKSS